MPRVLTRTVVARVPGQRCRPTSIGKEKRHAVSFDVHTTCTTHAAKYVISLLVWNTNEAPTLVITSTYDFAQVTIYVALSQLWFLDEPLS